MVVVGGFDKSVTIYRVSDGKVFRRHKLSQSSYPVAMALDNAGLFLAVAMSDGVVMVLDFFSGNTIASFSSLAGIVTSVQFHQSDLVLASFSGVILRWQLPSIIHRAIAERDSENRPVLNILLGTDKPDMTRDTIPQVVGSLMKGMKPEPDWIFREMHGDRLPDDRPLAQEITDEEDEVEQGGFDAPRPSVAGEYESKVDDIMRASFMRQKNEESGRKTPISGSSDMLSEVLAVPRSRSRGDSEGPPMPELALVGTDPFIIPDEPKKTRAEEMRDVATEIAAKYDRAKSFLAVRPEGHEEVTAHLKLKNVLDSIKRDLIGEQCSQIREFTQQILSVVDQMT
jgi:hypothetical protein